MKRVLVAMSGGVDSSVAACLLKEGGYEVIGATMRIWKETDGTDHPYGCCGVAHVEDARRVAQQLGIPFYVLNLEEAFEREVIAYFCEEYERGRTPNPCILCNERIKFGSLLERAKALGAHYLATGHYARVGLDPASGRFLLKRGIDPKKDQSYVLFSLSQDQLRHCLFPLGIFRKGEVRGIASSLGLRVHDKPESQEICFIHDRSYHSFLEERLKSATEPGPIVDKNGTVLGRHRGIPFYTIGQRRGLRLARGVPLYVVALDPKRNVVVVGEKHEVFRDTFVVRRVNWIPEEEAPSSCRAWVKIRYNHPGAEAVLFRQGDRTLKVQFKEPQKAITPGQAAVFYDGETVLGGGWIEEVL